MSSIRSDDQLRSLVLDELAWDAFVDETQIDAAVNSGVVTLVGTVPAYAMKLAAQTAVGSVEGVHDVIDEIDVRLREGLSITDEELERMVTQVLRWDALVPDEELSVSVRDGRVTLTGQVATASQRTEAERMIAHLDGIRGVNNAITITSSDLRPEDVRAAIGDALARRAQHGLNRVDVTIDGAHVTLRGDVQSEAERTAILGAVAHAPGVAGVVCDELRISPDSEPRRVELYRR
ncbi:MAG: BON domain-containing protein [Actinomycetota bacterium]